MSPLEALLALNQLPKIGPIRIRRLMDAFGSPENILRAPLQQLLRVEGIGHSLATTIHQWQDHADPIGEIQGAEERGISIITQDHENYPTPLRQAFDAPLLLYVWGEIKKRDQHGIGVVGSRRSTHYGTQITRKLSYQLAHSGFTIISGMARGIDTAAHEAAIAANGRTVAVIGSGLKRIYPPENMALAEKIAAGNGAVVSEFPLDTPPSKQTFPMRNRIVAAWSSAMLVTECPAWSGALITANLAGDYGRPVFAVPGAIDRPTSAGCNHLIREGATLVTDGREILADLGELPSLIHYPEETTPTQHQTTPAKVPNLDTQEATVFAALDSSESTVDQLIERCHMQASAISSTLLKLEIRGLIHACPGSRYVRSIATSPHQNGESPE